MTTKISAMAAASALGATDVVAGVQAGGNVQISMSQIRTFLGLAVTSGKTLTVSNSITLAGTDATVMTFPTTSATIARTDAAQTFTGVQTFANNVLPSVDASFTVGSPSAGWSAIYSAGNIRAGTNGLFYFTSKGEFGSSVDGTFFYRNAAETIQTFFSIPASAAWQFGAANAAAPVAQTLQVQGARGGTDTNTAGQNWTINPSLGTGTGAPGNIILNGGIGKASSNTQHTTAAAMTVQSVVVGQLPGVVIGSAALATNATDGFLWIASGAGQPTGTPTSFTGRVPLYYDTTNHQLWVFDAAWLQPKTPAGAALVTWQ